MKRLIATILLAASVLLLAACGKTKTVTCDNCGKTVRIAANSEMDDSWIIFCSDCEKTLGLDKIAE